MPSSKRISNWNRIHGRLSCWALKWKRQHPLGRPKPTGTGILNIICLPTISISGEHLSPTKGVAASSESQRGTQGVAKWVSGRPQGGGGFVRKQSVKIVANLTYWRFRIIFIIWLHYEMKTKWMVQISYNEDVTHLFIWGVSFKIKILNFS